MNFDPAKALFTTALLLLGILGIVLAAVALLCGFHVLERATATAHSDSIWNVYGDAVRPSGSVSVWVLTPYVRPGDVLVADVAIYGGYRVGIDRLSGVFAGQPFAEDGTGATWGGTISHKSGSRGSDSVRLRLPVPAGAQPGQRLNLQIHVAHTLALSADGGFENREADAELSVPIVVQSTASALAWRLFGLLRAAVAFAAVVGLGCKFRPQFHEFERWLDRNVNPNFLLLPGSAIFISYVVLGYGLFALPLMIAVGLTASWIGYVLTAVWVVMPFVAIYRLTQPFKARPTTFDSLREKVLVQATADPQRLSLVDFLPQLRAQHLFSRPVPWRNADPDAAREAPNLAYVAEVAGQRWQLQINDFPAEQLYTLLIDGQPALSFNQWPETWQRPAAAG